LIAVSANPKEVGGGEVGDIFLVSQGAPARRIIGSDGDGVAQACPRFSPDGLWLAYGEAQASDPVTTFRGVWPVANRAVVVVGINSHGDASPPIMRVKLPTDPGQIACPKWSPGGKELAFRFGSELWVADASSGTKAVFPVTEAPWGQQGFEWSRDGSRIAVAEPGKIRVVRMGVGSTLIPVKGATPRSLGWTADDDRIIYTSTDLRGDGLAANVIGVGGDNDTQLTPEGADAIVSPDGTRVAYASVTYRCTTDGCSQVLITLTDGSILLELPITPDFGGPLQWSPDGERLLFGSIAGVVSVAVAPGSPAVIYTSGELNLEWSGSELTWQPVFP
jgi:Tol biopolymer transport system component